MRRSLIWPRIAREPNPMRARLPIAVAPVRGSQERQAAAAILTPPVTRQILSGPISATPPVGAGSCESTSRSWRKLGGPGKDVSCRCLAEERRQPVQPVDHGMPTPTRAAHGRERAAVLSSDGIGGGINPDEGQEDPAAIDQRQPMAPRRFGRSRTRPRYDEARDPCEPWPAQARMQRPSDHP